MAGGSGGERNGGKGGNGGSDASPAVSWNVIPIMPYARTMAGSRESKRCACKERDGGNPCVERVWKMCACKERDSGNSETQ